VALLWKYLAQPMLFAVIGASIDFSEIDANTIPNAVLVIVIGVTCRMIVAMAVTYGAGLNMKERVFIGMSWIPKATVQAALGSIPLALIEENISKEDADYEEYQKWGKDILVTAVFAILITAPIGVICIDYFGPRWLEKENADDETHELGSEDGDTKKKEQNWIIGEATRRVDVEVKLEANLVKLESFFKQMRTQVDNLTYQTNNGNGYDKFSYDDSNRTNEGMQASLSMLREGIAALEEEVYNSNSAQEFNANSVYKLAESFVIPSIDIDPISGQLCVTSVPENAYRNLQEQTTSTLSGIIQLVRRRSSGGSQMEMAVSEAVPSPASPAQYCQ
jgi:hypothetical protein